jgi:hypothetical protein
MPTMTALPPNLREKLTSVTRRIRRLQVLRGFSWLIVGMSVLAGLSMLADYGLDLSPGIRETLLGVWFGLGGVVFILGVAIPRARRLEPQALAAAVEAEFPDLKEQLTSSVELAEVTDIHHGSPVLIDLLIDETQLRTSRLNFRRAIPAGRSAGWSVLAGAAVLLILSPALLWPGRYWELGQRFLLPWRETNGAAPYTFTILPGDAFAAKGRPLTVSVWLVPENEHVSLPQTCTLVRTDEEGITSRELMSLSVASPEAGGSRLEGGFSLTLPRLSGNFQYHIEANIAKQRFVIAFLDSLRRPDTLISDTYQLTAVEPIEIEANSPTITVTPPVYARGNIPTQKVHELTDLSALQHSRVSFHLRFTRPAVSASVKISEVSKTKLGPQGTALGQEPNAESKLLPLQLSADRREGRIELPALSDINYQIILEAEHGIRTELEPRLLNVRIDRPPQFTKVTGAEDIKALSPYDRLPLEVTLTDDVGVDRAEVEYRINQRPSLFERIPLDGGGKQNVVGKHDFLLAGKVKDGDEISYRLKAADNRRIPEAGLGPQVVYFPPEGAPGQPRWQIIKINRQALPRGQQEIIAQHDTVSQRLEAIKTALLKEQRGVYKLRMESRGQSVLNPEQKQAFEQLRQENRGNEKALRELAHEAAEAPALQAIAERAQQVADRELQHSNQDLQQAEKETSPEQRDKHLQNTDQDLASALRKLEEMRQDNDRVAQARLDQLKLENLAGRQEQLAQQADVQAATDQAKDPKSRDMGRQLQRDQDEVAKDFQQQIDKSDVLKKALESSWADEIQQLAKRARELAKAERELKQAAQETNQRLNEKRLGELAKKQQELADKIGKLSDQTRQSAQAAVTSSLKPDQAKKAAEALQQGDAEEAIRRQSDTARQLDKLAADFNKAREQARNPREAAYQLLHLQDDLRARFAEANRKSSSSDKPREDFERDQKNVKNALEKFTIPAGNSQAENERRNAAERAGQAAEAFRQNDLREANQRMAQARQSLDRMAKQLADQKPAPDQKAPVPDPAPGLPSREEVNQAQQLAKQQRDLREAVRRAVNAPVPVKNAKENPLTELAKQQQQLANQAAELAQEIAQDQGQKTPPTTQARQAAQSAQQTSDQIQAGAIRRARQTGQQTAQQLRQLGHELTQTPDQPQKAKDQAKQAEQLAQNQDDLNRRMAALADRANAQQLQQQARQEDLSRQTGELNRALGQLALETRQAPTMQAFISSQQARAAMEQAHAHSQEGNQVDAQQSRQQAADALDRAAQQADQAAQQLAARQEPAAPNAQANKQTGQALEQAQGQIKQSQSQLSQGQNRNAQAAMHQAAQSLQQAAQRVAQQARPGQPSPTTSTGQGIAALGTPDLNILGKDVQKYAGKSWGELPGELRNQILQDVTTKYGDDYARIIKLYFEKIADTKKVGSGQ